MYYTISWFKKSSDKKWANCSNTALDTFFFTI